MTAVPGSADLEGILSQGPAGASHPDAQQVDAQPGATQRDLLDTDRFQALPANTPGPASSLRAITAPAPGVSVRRFPAAVDIWLYPFSRSGLLTLGLVFGVPGVMVLAGLGAWYLCQASLLFLILLGPVLVLTLLGTVVMALYLIWYVCQCVRDSASGGLRAPDPLESVPGLDELLGHFWLCMAASAGTALPAGLYGIWPSHNQTVLNVLLALGAFVLPMAWLSVCIEESISAIHPIQILSQIRRGLVPYCALVVLICGLGAGVAGAWIYVSRVCACGVGLYAGLVMAHLVGRFQFRHQVL